MVFQRKQMLYLIVLLQLVLEFIFSCLPFTMQQYRGLKLNLFKFITALYVAAYSVITRFVEIRGNCYALRATVIGVFIFTSFLNKVGQFILICHMYYSLRLPVAHQVCSVDVIYDIVVWWMVKN
jgi:hypothetical protein